MSLEGPYSRGDYRESPLLRASYLALVAWIFGFVLAGPVRAEAVRGRAHSETALERDARELTRALRKRGFHVEREPLRLLTRASGLELPTVRAGKEGCQSWIVLGTRNLSFSLVQLGSANDFVREVPSERGAVQLTVCGTAASEAARILVESRSSRGLVEIFSVRGSSAPPWVGDLLPSRDAGPYAPEVALGRAADAPSPSVWLEKERKRLATLGAKVERGARHLNSDGMLEYEMEFDLGCHELVWMIPAASQESHSLEVQLRSVTDLLARERSSSPLVRIRYCATKFERVHVGVAGGVGGTELEFLEAQFPLPEGVPLDLGPELRRNVLHTLWAERPPALFERPYFRALSAQGQTRFRVPVRARACYLVASAVASGELEQAQLALDFGSLHLAHVSVPDQPGARVMLCTEGAGDLEISSTVFGENLTVGLLVWETVSP